MPISHNNQDQTWKTLRLQTLQSLTLFFSLRKYFDPSGDSELNELIIEQERFLFDNVPHYRAAWDKIFAKADSLSLTNVEDDRDMKAEP
jgi:hypothetical protein